MLRNRVWNYLRGVVYRYHSMETRASMSELDHDTARHSPSLDNPTLSARATVVPPCCSGYPGRPAPGLSAGAPCEHCVPP